MGGVATSGAQGSVFVFTPDGSTYPGGVFADRQEAEEWITRVGAHGMLSEYALGQSAYDARIEAGLFQPKRDAHRTDRYMARFTTPLDHWHYEGSGQPSEPGQPHERTWAVIRVDGSRSADGLTIKEVLPTRGEALAEVERLSQVNADKECSYHVQLARVRPDGLNRADDYDQPDRDLPEPEHVANVDGRRRHDLEPPREPRRSPRPEADAHPAPSR